MYPRSIQKLIDLFTKLPGIGPRQAARFVFFLLKDKSLIRDLADGLKSLETVSSCTLCFRSTEANGEFCRLCLDPKRNKTAVAVVEKESDMQNLEKTGAYQGLYHVLGGTISPLDSNSTKNLHLRELHSRIKNILEKGECEIILATSATTEGDTTALYIDRILSPLKNQYPLFKISRLGRGLSLGSELEYADEVTLKNALTNRK